MEFEVKILDEAGLLEFQGGAPKQKQRSLHLRGVHV